MIVVRLIGGLGNQMFQYAAGRSLAMHHNTGLVLDTSYLERDPEGAYTIRHYELDKFNISAKIADREILDHFNFKTPRLITKIKALFPTLFKNVVFNEYQVGFQEQFFKLPANTYLNGYWQDQNYFVSHREALRKEFDLKEQKSIAYTSILEKITTTNSVSVHVRHGDYISLGAANNFHGVLPLTYYMEAVKLVESGQSGANYFIFSDDLDWCKQNLGFIKNATFIEGKKLNLNSQEELLLMSHCKHNIIANSSFSWWAAWLNDNVSKIVITPKNWFKADPALSKSLIPSTWVQI